MLTPEIIEDLRRILPTMMYFESVGDYLGVERTTWRGWLKRGRIESRRLTNPKNKPLKTEALYLEFFNTYKKAVAEGEFCDSGTIRKATSEHWQAAAWRLERRFPERWGRDNEQIRDLLKRVKELEGQLSVNHTQPAEAPVAETGATPEE